MLPFIGKTLFQSGEQIAQDMKSGTPIGAAFKKGAKRTLDVGKAKVLQTLSGNGRKRKLQRKTHKKKSRKTDYFSL